jgi:hypothetical protein
MHFYLCNRFRLCVIKDFWTFSEISYFSLDKFLNPNICKSQMSKEGNQVNKNYF